MADNPQIQKIYKPTWRFKKLSEPKLDQNKPTPRHVTVKLPNIEDKERNSLEQLDRDKAYQKVLKRNGMTSDFSFKSMEAGRKWDSTFRVKEENPAQKILQEA